MESNQFDLVESAPGKVAEYSPQDTKGTLLSTSCASVGLVCHQRHFYIFVSSLAASTSHNEKLVDEEIRKKNTTQTTLLRNVVVSGVVFTSPLST